MSRIDAPGGGGSVPTRLAVAGVAFAGDRGISRVEVSTDGGATWAPAQLEGRLTLTGELPWLRGLGYRLTLDASSTARGPYVAGPIQAATPTQPSAQLAPIDRLRAGVGLQYDF